MNLRKQRRFVDSNLKHWNQFQECEEVLLGERLDNELLVLCKEEEAVAISTPVSFVASGELEVCLEDAVGILLGVERLNDVIL